MRVIRLPIIAVALAVGFLSAGANAVELKVLSAGALRAVLQELAPAYEKASGNKLNIDYGTAGAIEQKIAGDDEIDVVILTKPRLDKLVSAAKVVGGSAKPLARAELGVAVKAGAPAPDISSVEAVKKALLSAKSVAYADPASGATSGAFLAQAFEKLGIAAELKPKTRLVSASGGQGPRVGEVVAHGDAAIGIQPISELMEVKGITIVGPLPAELQNPDMTYVAAAPYTAAQPLAAKQLIDFLGDAKRAAVYKAKGLQPGGGRPQARRIPHSRIRTALAQ